MRVAVLRDRVPPGAPADELDNARQAAAVQQALEDLGHEAAQVPIGLDLEAAAAELLDLRPDAVFNLVEALDGHDRLCPAAPALAQCLGLPHTGGGAFALAATADKLRTKAMLAGAGLPTPPWLTARGGGSEDIPAGPYIIKPVYEHGSVGIDEDSVVFAAGRSELLGILAARSRALGLECFAEGYVDGREFNVAVLDGPHGPEVLPQAEMLFRDWPAGRPRVVGYRAKWDESAAQYHDTVRRFEHPEGDAPLLYALAEASLGCAALFGLSGYSRVDFRVTDRGEPMVIDVNVNPCIAPEAGFCAAAARAGIDYRAMVDRILQACLPKGRA